jgi:uncharacterized delta-60 repeat protein
MNGRANRRSSWCGLGRLASVLLPVTLALVPFVCSAQNVMDLFDPVANGQVNAVAVQTDGKILVGGAFTTVNGQARLSVARLNHDGSLDTTFVDPNADGAVDSLFVQADGKIIVGGGFTHIGGQPHTRVARLQSDGTPDATFADPVVDGPVYALAVQADGKILIGGAFAHVSGQQYFRIARLNADGSLDPTSIDTDASSEPVWALAVQHDNKILAAGTNLNFGSGQFRSGVARLNSDGSVDDTFVDPQVSSTTPFDNFSVYALALQADGKVVIGGAFTSVGGQTRHGLARLNDDGNVDMAFGDSNASSAEVSTLGVQADGKIVETGLGLDGMGAASYEILRLNPNGGFDNTFRDPRADGAVLSMAFQTDGSIVVGGAFIDFGSGGRDYIARLNYDGTLDQVLFGFTTGTGQVSALVVQADGPIIVGGAFTSMENLNTSGPALARMLPSGIVDATYNPDPTAASPAAINVMALQPDGKLVVAGYFTAIGGQARNKIARLSVDGSADSGFDASQNPNDFVSALAVQPDGKIVVGGPFTYISAKTRNHIARLNADGTLDTAFDPNADSGVGAIWVLADGKLLVAGSFATIGGQTRHGVARLDSAGVVDTTFVDPGANGNISTLVVQPDGKIIVGGFFTMIGGQTQCCIARLNADGSLDQTFSANPDNYVEAVALQLDGKIVIGGQFNYVSGQFREYLARLNADGSLDMTFTANADNSVLALALQRDGKLIVGGLFGNLGGQSRTNIARLEEAEPTQQSFEAIGYSKGESVVTWRRSGTGPELGEPPQLFSSTDAETYTAVGSMQRFNGGWRYVGLALPLGQYLYLRATGRFESGQLDGSGGMIDAGVQFYSQQNDGIFADGFE